MKERLPLSLNLSGRLMNLSIPKIMGILNVSPDSFYEGSRNLSCKEISNKIDEIIAEGADFIDIGGCSTRPGSIPPSIDEEWRRINPALRLIREKYPLFPLSVDTFRSEIARKAIEEFNVQMINDISGGELDPELWNVVAENHVAYVLTHSRGNPENMNQLTDYDDVTANVITEISKKVNELHRLGVCDIIIDPGFGFAKTIDQNFKLLSELEQVAEIGLPVLIGISRKSMIYKTLDVSPEDSLAGTIALQAIALEKGANIIRTHDVREAVETARLVSMLKR